MYFGFYLCNLSFLFVALNLVSFAAGAANFTDTPRDVTVYEGQNVSIVWKYNFGNKNTEFQSNSPVWNYYDQSGTKYEIAIEDKFDSWKWKLSPSCPARLKRRVSKADNATLVITNVSLADSGKYECILVLKFGSPPTSSMQLTVRIVPITSPPTSGSTPDETTTASPVTPTTIPSSTTPPPTPHAKGLTGGEIVGIVIGVLAVLVIIGGCCYWFLVKKKKKEENQCNKDKEMSNKVSDEEGSPPPKAASSAPKAV